MNAEEKLIENYPRYLISCDGIVTNISSGRVLSGWISNLGYQLVDLTNDNGIKKLLVHRLVAKAFIPNTENKPYINHMDGSKLNNNKSNLEWCTQAENVQHAFDTGLAFARSGVDSHMFGRRNMGNSRAVVAIDSIGVDFVFSSAREAVRQGYATSGSGISNCISGFSSSHNKMKWRHYHGQ